jgi:hypothetical protein
MSASTCFTIPEEMTWKLGALSSLVGLALAEIIGSQLRWI